MVIKEIRNIKRYYDNPKECDKEMNDYEIAGYRILRHGADDNYWFFECEFEG